jgi:hypothetical protein
MAKKKSEPSATDAPKKSAAKSGAKSKSAKPAAPTAAPMVDTAFAAQAAARMLTAKAGGITSSAAPSSTAPAGEKKETSAFKQMKQSMTKPHAAGVGNILNSTISPAAKKGNLPFHGGRQVGHNQTFGSDASKNFVPRRTGG